MKMRRENTQKHEKGRPQGATLHRYSNVLLLYDYDISGIGLGRKG
jgi:hypothetical protein